MRPPQLIISKLKRLPGKHFSLSDWDFQVDKGWHLTTDQFVSSPSSLARTNIDEKGPLGWVFLKTALGSNIPQGRIITYHRFMHTGWPAIWVHFRAQALPTNDYPLNEYRLEHTQTITYLRQRVNGTDTLLHEQNNTYTATINTWRQHRITWYTYIGADLALVMRVTWETLITGTWVTQLLKDITSPLWEGTTTNRLGLTIASYWITAKSFIDDTEIWKRA